jgi:hypothetical protein
MFCIPNVGWLREEKERMCDRELKKSIVLVVWHVLPRRGCTGFSRYF